MSKSIATLIKGLSFFLLVLLSATGETYAQCNAEINPKNLITNGDFETPISSSDASGMSDYGYSANGVSPGKWTISSPVLIGSSYVPATVNGQPGDHTKGNATGHYMVIDVNEKKNPDGSFLDAWFTTVTVQKNTTYFFSAYIANINKRNRVPSKLKFYVGDEDISNGVIITPPGAEVADETLADHSWGQFFASWNSGNLEGPVVIRMKNQFANTDGNDMALDDITFSTSCKWVTQLEKSHFPLEIPVCNSSPVTLNPGITENGTFAWYKDDLNGTPLGTDRTLTVNGGQTANYYFCYTINSCSRLDTARVVNKAIPLDASTIPPATCGGNGSVVLKGLVPNQVYDVSYTYETSAPFQGTLTANNNGELVITGKKGFYRSIVLKANGCSSSPPKDVELKDPPAPVIEIDLSGTSLPSNCNSTKRIRFNGVLGLVEGQMYKVSYYAGSDPNPVIVNLTATSDDKRIDIENLRPNTYSRITVTDEKNCVSNALSFDLLPEGLPKITATPSPVTCAGNDGKIAIQATALESGKDYDFVYTHSGITTTIPKRPTSTTLSFEITGLSAGDYTGIAALLAGQTCGSNAVNVTVGSPLIPTIVAVVATDANCEDKEGKLALQLSNLESGSYQIHYEVGGVSQTKTVSSTGSTLNTDLTGLVSGSYSKIKINKVGSTCYSPEKQASIGKASIPTISVQGHNPTDCGVSDGSMDITGTNFVQGTAYTVTYTKDAESPKTTDITAASTTLLGSLNALASGTYAKISVTEKGKNCKSNESQTTLADPSSPAIVSIDDDNGPTNCNGSDGKLILNANNLKPATVYVIHYTLAGVEKTLEQTASAATQQWTIPSLTAGDYSSIYVIEKGKVCKSPATTATLTDPPALTITLQNVVAPSCVGGDGAFSVSVTPTEATKTYDLSYEGPNGLQTVSQSASTTSLVFQLTSLEAGNYTNIVVKEQNKTCGSNAETVTWTAPAIPSLTVTSTNPTTCEGADGSITLNAQNLIAGKTYDVMYKRDNGDFITTTYSANALTGMIAIPNLSKGSYTEIAITETGKNCKSNQEGATLVDPTAPFISVTGTNPTSCGATDGTLTISGLTASGAYDIAYNNGTDVTLPNQTADAQGKVVITGLGIDIFDKITASSKNCKSNEVTFTLVNPDVPQITAIPTDPSTCGGTNGSIAITGLTNGNAYDISYFFNNGSPVVLTNQTVSGGQVLISSLAAGDYTNIKAKLIGTPCESPEVYTLLEDPAKPVVSGTVGSNPITCQGSEGSVEIAGLTSGRPHNISYTVGGSAVNVSNLTATATGTLAISGLKAETYSSIVVTDAVTLCVSDPAGPVSLVDPNAPQITLQGNNPAVCAGNGSLEIGNLVASTAYQVSYEDPLPVGPLALTADADGKIFVAVPAGNYTNVRVTWNNCPSNALGTTLVAPIEQPLVSILPSAIKICEGTSVTFKAVPTSGGTAPTYVWKVNDTDVGVSGDEYTNDALEDNDIVTVTLTSSASCADPKTADSDPIVMDVIANPVPTVTGDITFCEGSSTPLTANGGSASATYQWFRNNVKINTATQKGLDVNEGGSYTVTITEDICPATSVPLVVTSIKVLVDAGADQELMLEDLNQKEALVYLQGSGNGNKHLWTSTPNVPLSDPTVYNPEALLTPGTYTFLLTDSIGECTASDEVIVAIYTKVRIPNAFSPNGDGKNETWVIDGLEKYPDAKVKVFNRWGSSVFTDNYGYRVPWDGTAGGSLLASGTYYYVVELKGSSDGNEEVRTGSLTIVR